MGVNLNEEGRLGSPNPSANPIGEHQAYDEAQFELVDALSSFEIKIEEEDLKKQ